MTPQRKRRLALISLMLVSIGIAVALILNAFQKNLLFFFSPTQVIAGEAPLNHPFRIGGMVKEGSLTRSSDGLSVNFVVTDYSHDVNVTYTGILPDLFREGQGIVALGKVNSQRQLIASEVLAKHDENYMPPEVKNALEKAHVDGIKNLESARD